MCTLWAALLDSLCLFRTRVFVCVCVCVCVLTDKIPSYCMLAINLLSEIPKAVSNLMYAVEGTYSAMPIILSEEKKKNLFALVRRAAEFKILFRLLSTYLPR